MRRLVYNLAELAADLELFKETGSRSKRQRRAVSNPSWRGL